MFSFTFRRHFQGMDSCAARPSTDIYIAKAPILTLDFREILDCSIGLLSYGAHPSEKY